MKPIIPTNQTQLVKQKLGFDNKSFHEITEKVSVPGIENLHLKSVEEIAKVLAMLLKSKATIKSITYRVGEFIELTSDSDIKV